MQELEVQRDCFASNILKVIAESKIIPIVDASSVSDIERLSDIYFDAGFRTLEVKMDSHLLEPLVSVISQRHPEIYLLAGTCMSSCDFRRAKHLGMDIMISPCFDKEMMSWACLHSIPYIPAICTKEDLASVLPLGFSVVKFYPAEKSGGANFLRKLYPEYDVRFMASGGITLEKIPEYLELQNVAAVCTSHIVSLRLLEEKRWQEIEKRIQAAIELLRKVN